MNESLTQIRRNFLAHLPISAADPHPQSGLANLARPLRPSLKSDPVHFIPHNRLWRELTGLHNSMFGLEDEIKDACQNDKEVADKIAGVYSAIESLQDELTRYQKKEKD